MREPRDPPAARKSGFPRHRLSIIAAIEDRTTVASILTRVTRDSGLHWSHWHEYELGKPAVKCLLRCDVVCSMPAFTKLMNGLHVGFQDVAIVALRAESLGAPIAEIEAVARPHNPEPGSG